MSTRPFTLLPSDAAWRVTTPGATDDVQVEADAPPAEVAAAVAARLRQRGYQGEGVLLALPSAWCLSAVISTADLPRQDRGALLFRLEEKLPLAAEHFTADFVPLGDRALGVCVPNDRVVPLVAALERAGVVVQSIAPAALLAVQSLGDHAPGARIVLLREGERVNLVSVEGGRPVGWSLADADPQSLRTQLDLALMDLGDAAIKPHDLPPALAAALADYDLPETTRREQIDQSAASLTPAVLSGRVAPWVELRRDALAIEDRLRVVRRPINAALAAAAVFLLVAAGVFLYRAQQYDALARAAEVELADEFRREFPGWQVPPNVRAVVASELRKRKTAGSSALPAEAQESALRVLRELLANLKPEAVANLSLDQLTINDTSLEITGRARANQDVDPLVAAARAAGLDVPPPQLSKAPGPQAGWTFTVRGSKPLRVSAGSAGGGSAE